MPFKRHSAETIESVITGKSGKGQAAPVDDTVARKIRAWWSMLLPYLLHILSTLNVKFGVVYAADMAPREIIRVVVNTHHYPHTRSVFSPGKGFGKLIPKEKSL